MLARYTFLEKTSTSSRASATTTLERGSPCCDGGAAGRDFVASRCARYHPPTRVRITIAARAAAENQATLRWPRGTTTKAASRGPIAEPALPPTWNSDCAKPCRPPDAILATREDSGWKTAEPSPTRPAESRRTGKPGAMEGGRRPGRLNPIPGTGG